MTEKSGEVASLFPKPRSPSSKKEHKLQALFQKNCVGNFDKGENSGEESQNEMLNHKFSQKGASDPDFKPKVKKMKKKEWDFEPKFKVIEKNWQNFESKVKKMNKKQQNFESKLKMMEKKQQNFKPKVKRMEKKQCKVENLDSSEASSEFSVSKKKKHVNSNETNYIKSKNKEHFDGCTESTMNVGNLPVSVSKKTFEAEKNTLLDDNIMLDEQSLLVKAGESVKIDCDKKKDAVVNDYATVRVENLPYDVTDEDVQKLFSKFGEIGNLNVVRTKYTNICKGFAFVNFKTVESKEQSLSADDLEIKGRMLVVKDVNFSSAAVFMSKKRTLDDTTADVDYLPKAKRDKRDNRRTIFIANLPFDVKNKDLLDVFSKFGKIEDVTVIRSQFTGGAKYAFLDFETVESKENALSAGNFFINGRRLFVNDRSSFLKTTGVQSNKKTMDYPTPGLTVLSDAKKTLDKTRTVFITNLPSGITDEDVQDLFSKFGDIENINAAKTKYTKGYAFSNFKPVESKDRSLLADDVEVNGQSLIVEDANSSRTAKVKSEKRTVGHTTPCSSGLPDTKREFDNTRTIFIRNLPSDVKDEDVQNVFSKFGEIENMKVVRMKHTNIVTGTGIINFKNVESKESALAAVDIKVNGQIVMVGYLNFPKPETEHGSTTTVFIGHLPQDVTDEDLQNGLLKFGEIENLMVVVGQRYGIPKRYALANFKSVESKEDALSSGSIEVNGYTLRIKAARPFSRTDAKYEYDNTRTIFVRNIPLALKREVVQNLFLKFGEVDDVNLLYKPHDKSGIGFVTFKDVESKKKALLADNLEIGGQNLRVKDVKSTSRTPEKLFNKNKFQAHRYQKNVSSR